MTEPFITYKVFNDPDVASKFAEILGKFNVPYVVEEDAYNFDPSYANHPLNKDYRVKVRQDDFSRANDAFAEHFKSIVDSVEPDYYLFDFTSEELMEILLKPDEWGELDYQLAKKILNDRGRPVHEELLVEFKAKRLEQLRKPEETEYTSMVLGYIFSLLFPPAGIFLGHMLAFSKKNLPDGKSTFAYSDTQRLHGRVILIIGSVITTIMVIIAVAEAIS